MEKSTVTDNQNGAQLKCNHGYKSRGVGRAKSLVTRDDFVTAPDKTMLALAHIKNNECLSWRELADEYLPQYSHAYVRKVALGEAKSDAISIALGVKPEPPQTVTVPPHMVLKRPRRPDKETRYRSNYEHGRGEQGRASKAQLEAEMRAAGCESFGDYVDYLRKVNK